MNHFVKLDTFGFIVEYSYSDVAPNTSWVGVDDALNHTVFSGRMHKLVNGRAVETDIPKLPPAPGFVWRDGAWRLDIVLAAQVAREKRDLLIAKSDWTQLPDVDPAIKDKWQPYRQALRDITSQPGFPENIQWPEPPK